MNGKTENQPRRARRTQRSFLADARLAPDETFGAAAGATASADTHEGARRSRQRAFFVGPASASGEGVPGSPAAMPRPGSPRPPGK